MSATLQKRNKTNAVDADLLAQAGYKPSPLGGNNEHLL